MRECACENVSHNITTDHVSGVVIDVVPLCIACRYGGSCTLMTMIQLGGRRIKKTCHPRNKRCTLYEK